MLGVVLAIVLVLLLVGGLPAWGWHQWGYGPSGILGTILIIVLVVWLLGGLR